MSESAMPKLFTLWCAIHENEDELTLSPSRWLKAAGVFSTLLMMGMAAVPWWVTALILRTRREPEMDIWQLYAAALLFATMGVCFLLVAFTNHVFADYARIRHLALSQDGITLSAWWNASRWSWTEVEQLDMLCFRSVRKRRARLLISIFMRGEKTKRHVATFAIGWRDADTFRGAWPIFAESLRRHVRARLILRDQYSDQNKIITLVDTGDPGVSR